LVISGDRAAHRGLHATAATGDLKTPEFAAPDPEARAGDKGERRPKEAGAPASGISAVYAVLTPQAGSLFVPGTWTRESPLTKARR